MTREELRTGVVRFLRTIQRPDAPLDGDIDEHASLVESGLIDSLAVMQIITYLEDEHGLDLAAAAFDPESLRSVGGILDLIQQRKAG